MSSQFNVTSLIDNVSNDWKDILRDIVEPYRKAIDSFMTTEYQTYEGLRDVLPCQDFIFRAFSECSFRDVKVVIIGQDCYPTKGDAMGMCFSVPNGTRCPPSLRNIFKEIQHEYNVQRKETDLSDWAKQGVLLLNTALTVREGAPGSHLKTWKDFTRDVVKYIAKTKTHVCYILWGEHAISFKQHVDETQNCILTHSHPSPLSRRPFVGCNHFKLSNEYLSRQGFTEIQWV
jgi:uracil-DNA glycosylase